MIFEPLWLSLVKRTVIVLVIVTAYLWVSTDETEFEDTRVQTQTLTVVPEPEEELPVYADPEPQFGWVTPPKEIRARVAKVKRRIKKSVEK